MIFLPSGGLRWLCFRSCTCALATKNEIQSCAHRSSAQAGLDQGPSCFKKPERRGCLDHTINDRGQRESKERIRRLTFGQPALEFKARGSQRGRMMWRITELQRSVKLAQKQSVHRGQKAPCHLWCCNYHSTPIPRGRPGKTGTTAFGVRPPHMTTYIVPHCYVYPSPSQPFRLNPAHLQYKWSRVAPRCVRVCHAKQSRKNT